MINNTYIRYTNDYMNKQQLIRPTTLRIEPELKVWVIQQANKENRSFSNMLKHIIKDYKAKIEQS